MKSFPSSFTKNSLVHTGVISGNIKQTLKNLAGQMMNFVLSASKKVSPGAITKDSLSENIVWVEQNYDDLLKNSDTASSLILEQRHTPMSSSNISSPNEQNKVIYENAFKIPSTVLNAINKYKRPLAYTAVQQNLKAKKRGEKQADLNVWDRTDVPATQSLFNPFYAVSSAGITLSVPLWIPTSKNITSSDKFELKLNAKTGLEPGKGYKPVTMFDSTDKQEGKSSNNTEQGTGSETTAANQNNYAGYKTVKNTALYTEDYSKNGVGYRGESSMLTTIPVSMNNVNPDITDCSIRTLVNLSGGYGADPRYYKSASIGDGNNRNMMGRALYRYADFMFCKDLGKISNNHLITLRKFGTPIGDNIFKYGKESKSWDTYDKGRLVTWFGTDDNKLEDICKYNYNATWKKLEATIEDIHSKEDNSKILPSIINLANPNYWSAVAHGTAGGNNSILNYVCAKSGFLEAQGSYENQLDALYHMDTNKIYSQKNSVQENHIYEGKLVFNQEFNLTFSYKLRAYDGINPRNAMLDLLGNILEVTYKRGSFWGGARRFIGAPRNQAGWNKANQLFNKLENGLADSLEDLFGVTGWDDLGSWFKDMISKVGNFASDALEKGKQMAENIKNQGVGSALGLKGKGKMLAGGLVGMLKNKLGRPAVYAANSLVSGAPVGLWHLTVGNPRNPILSIGNLIVTNSQVTHSGPLGIDDFPTELKVVITLKHAKPRDLTEISQMYTMGLNGIYYPLDSQQISKYFSIGTEFKMLNSFTSQRVDTSDDKGKKQTINVETRTTFVDPDQAPIAGAGNITNTGVTAKEMDVKPNTAMNNPDVQEIGGGPFDPLEASALDMNNSNLAHT